MGSGEKPAGKEPGQRQVSLPLQGDQGRPLKRLPRPPESRAKVGAQSHRVGAGVGRGVCEA